MLLSFFLFFFHHIGIVILVMVCVCVCLGFFHRQASLDHTIAPLGFLHILAVKSNDKRDWLYRRVLGGTK